MNADRRAYYESMTNVQLLEEREHAWRIEAMLGNSRGLQTTARSARKRSENVGEVVMERMINGALAFDSGGNLIA